MALFHIWHVVCNVSKKMERMNRVTKNGERIPLETRSLISKRYRRITRAVNKEFWNSTSETAHSLYVGSYGRSTAIESSDLDVLLELPQEEYKRFDAYKGNGQSRLLQAVKTAVCETYPNTMIKADGQVIVVQFSDGMKFELLPAFLRQGLFSSEYIYPDTNMGGHWKPTDPKKEQLAMSQKNDVSNGLLYDTCKHIRYIRDNYFSSSHLSGIVIDSFVYSYMDNWHWTKPDEISSSEPLQYEQSLLHHFNSIYYSNELFAPGSHQRVEWNNSKDCLGKVLKYMIQ